MAGSFLSGISGKKKTLALAVVAAVMAGGSIASASAVDFDSTLIIGKKANLGAYEDYSNDGYGFNFKRADINLNIVNGTGISYGGEDSWENSPELKNAANLNINVTGENDLYGINSAATDGTFTRALSIKAGKMFTIDVNNSKAETGNAYGIYQHGTKAVSVDSNAKVSTKAANDSHAIRMNGDQQSKVSFNKNTAIKVNKDAKSGYAVYVTGAQGNIVNLNYEYRYENGFDDNYNTVTKVLQENMLDAKNVVTIDGDVYMAPITSRNPIQSKVNIGLGNANSYWNGVAFAPTGEVNMTLSNGAKWTNAVYANSTPVGFEGSRIQHLTGGDSDKNAGIIYQKDTNGLTIDRFTGNVKVVYDHSGDGANPGAYGAGAVTIKHADGGAGITLITDAEGVWMDEPDMVNDVLNSLASKLIYAGAIGGAETNLKGQVGIASSLTSLGEYMTVGDINYNAETGQGYYGEPPAVETSYDFTTALTGEKEKDTAYQNNGVISEDGLTYTFSKDMPVNIKVKNTDSAICLGTTIDNLSINATGRIVNLENTNDRLGSEISGLAKDDAGKLVFNADNLVIRSNNTGLGRAEGIHVRSENGAEELDATINSNVDINSYGNDYTLGVYTAGNSKLTINGNVTMRGQDGAYGIDNFGSGAYQHYSISALYAGSAYEIQKGSKLIVNGDVDVLVNGSGVIANGGSSYIELNGNTNIETNVDSSQRHFSVEAESATVNVNMNEQKDAAADHKVVLKGNVGTVVGAVHKDEPEKQSVVNIGLSTKDSLLHGVVINDFEAGYSDLPEFTGEVNLYLSNGAKWIHEIYGNSDEGRYEYDTSYVNKLVGGSTPEQAGIIHGKSDYGDIVINNYSGHTIVFYDHTGDGTDESNYVSYDNVTIKSATPDSGIVVVTDSAGITMSDNDMVGKVLNNLAGKLTYEGAIDKAENNLKGQVGIASGLTSDARYEKLEDITFSEETGQGSFVAPAPPAPPEQSITDFTSSLTGGADEAYVKGGVKVDEGVYKFTKNTNIRNSIRTDCGAIDLEKSASLDASGVDLSLTSQVKGASGVVAALRQSGATNLDITAKKLNVNVEASGDTSARAIEIKGNLNNDKTVANITADVNVSSTHAADNTSSLKNNGIYVEGNADLTINGNVTMGAPYGEYTITGAEGYGIYSKTNVNSKSPEVNINGLVDLHVQGNGIYADGGVINVQGGTVEIDPQHKFGGDAMMKQGYFTLFAGNGVLNMNTAPESANKVELKGNIGVIGTGSLNLVLNTKDSKLTGVALYAENLWDLWNNDPAGINMTLANGAVWENKVTGDIADGFKGSHLATLTGGDSIQNAGYIKQKDTRELTIDNYSGVTKVFYGHTGNGATADKYEAGGIRIKNAAEGSEIHIYTDKWDLPEDEAGVAEVMNVLAGKLTYEAAAVNSNLKGQVGIASGFTSEYLKTGDITFGENGQGTFVAPEPEGPTEQTGTEFTDGIFGRADEAYKTAGVKQADGSYVFTKNSNITRTEDANIKALENIDITLTDATLNLYNSTPYNDKVSGIQIGWYGDKKLTVEGNGTINMNISHGSDGIAAGIIAGNSGMGIYNKDTAVINANVNMQKIQSGSGEAYGILNNGSDITINGNLTMKTAPDDYGYSEAGVTAGTPSKVAGIMIGSKGDAAGNVTVNGNADLLVNGNGLVAEKGTITVGGGKVEVVKNTSTALYSVSTKDGKISLNEKGNENLTILGNMSITGNGSIDMVMNGSGSSLKGVVLDSTDNGAGVNMTLTNGAKWTNESYGAVDTNTGSHITKLVGGSSIENAGYIRPIDANEITIDSYSGVVKVQYDHRGDGTKESQYKAGGIRIKNAEEGSEIHIFTDHYDLPKDEEGLNTALNTLAGKLTYEAAAQNTNLKGQVGVASGFTSEYEKLGNITFNEVGKGTYVPETVPEPEGPKEQTTTEFSQGIFGGEYAENKSWDVPYREANVKQKDNSYLFTKDSSISAYDGAAIKTMKDVKIDAKNVTLSLAAERAHFNQLAGIQLGTGLKTLTLDAKAIDFNIHNVGAEVAGGIISGEPSFPRYNNDVAVITAALNMKRIQSDGGAAYGIFNEGSDITINGNLTMKAENGDYGVIGSKVTETAGIKNGIRGDYAAQSKVTVNGDVDLKIKGNGLVAEKGAITVGAGSIEIVEDEVNELYALLAKEGDVLVNMGPDHAGTDKDVAIKGNVAVMGQGNVELGLNSAESSLHGVAFYKAPEANTLEPSVPGIKMILANGATWTNEAYGATSIDFEGSHVAGIKGGNSIATAGVIYQKDANDLRIDTYVGSTKVIYDHSNDGSKAEDFAAGNIVVGQAISVPEMATEIHVITDNKGIDMENTALVNSVLNNLAGKLVYEANDKDLKGQVAIASGLTSDAEYKAVGDITFGEGGKGGFVAPEPPYDPTVSGYNETMRVGKPKGFESLYSKHDITSDNYSFSFAEDSRIVVADGDAINYTTDDTWSNSASITGAALTLDVTGTAALHGINIATSDDSNARNLTIGSKALNINVTNSGEAEGNASGIYQHGTKNLIINSDTVIKTQAAGNSYGIEMNGGKQSNVALNGNTTISVNKDAKNAYAVYVNGVEGNVVNINYDYAYEFKCDDSTGYNDRNVTTKDQIKSTEKTVKLDGDVFMAKKGGAQSIVSIGLAGADSYWNGVAAAESGYVNLAVVNGAKWTNEQFGTNAIDGFTGSHIMHLTGGDSAENAGLIYQKDEKDLTIRHYSGNTKVFYEHTGDGSAAENFAAGNIKVLSASAGSNMTLITDSTGIDMESSDNVNAVLNNMANKLYYMGAIKAGQGYDKDVDFTSFDQDSYGFVTNMVRPEQNLKGQVAIASGLTSAAEYLKLEDITFSEENGQGSFVAPEPEPPYNPYEDGFNETLKIGGYGDNLYKQQGVTNDNYNFTFAQDANIVINGSEGINYTTDADANNNAAIGGKVDLGVKVTNEGEAKGILMNVPDGSDTKSLTINTSKLDLDVKGTKAYGIYQKGTKDLNINADFNTFLSGSELNHVIHMEGGKESKVSLNGNVNIQNGVDATDRTAVYVGAVENNIVNINYDYSSFARTEWDDNGNEVVIEDIYSDKIKDASKMVRISGDIVIADLAENKVQSKVNIGLSGSASYWDGIVNANNGKVNIALQNGAEWIHQQASQGYQAYNGDSAINHMTGGTDAQSAGIITQKENSDITIDRLTGNIKVVYKHSGDGTTADDYKDGNVKINKADQGAGVIVMTDSQDITMDDEEMVNTVLNTLAGKLYYNGAIGGKEANLAGQVGIASGLTSEAEYLKLEDITFSDTTGQGSFVVPEPPAPPTEQTKIDFTTGITGGADTEYQEAYVEREEGIYTFDKNSNITLATKDSSPIDVQHDLTINAQESTLNLANSSSDFGTVAGIKHETGTTLEINADKVNVAVKATGDSSAKGISINGKLNNDKTVATINGDVAVNSDATTVTDPTFFNNYGIYVEGNAELTINGDVTMQGAEGAWGIDGARADGIRVKESYNYGAQPPVVNINGNVDLAVNGNGIFVEGGALSVDGANIKINKDLAAGEFNDGYYSVAVKDGVASVNAEGTEKVNLLGNVGVLGNGSLDLVLNSKESSLNGIAYNQAPKYMAMDAAKGLNLTLTNGATWTNEAYGLVKSDFEGSHVTSLVGGASAAQAGIILQKDAKDLTVDSLSGNVKVVYEHANAGTQAEDYAAGNVKVGSAVAGAGVTMVTDSKGITMTDKDMVNEVLDTLANKLVYAGAAHGEANLKGEVGIASGLTSDAEMLKLEDITFDTTTGQGGFVAPVDPEPEKPEPQPEPEKPSTNKESEVMKGIRSVHTTSALAWRANMLDTYKIADMADEDGIFAKTYGGKVEYNGEAIDVDDSYWGAQVGMDRALANGWHAGVAFDYRDGDADYINDGEGENDLYSFGFYGVKENSNGSELRLAAKFGKVDNEYTVHNEISSIDLQGDYGATAFGLTAAYAQRFESENGYIEPQVQLSWARVGSEDYTARDGEDLMFINQDAYNSIVGRLAIEAGKQLTKGNLYARLGLAHEFAGDLDTAYSTNVAGQAAKNTSFDGKDTWGEFSIGGNYQMSDNSLFYLDFTKDFGGDYEHKWDINAGLRFSF